MTATPSNQRRSDHWWEDAVVYQVYVRSFSDGNGDGIGDLDGLRRRLDHLADLGVDAIWLNPCYPSPQRDHGYDVADYTAIDPDYGTLGTFDAFVAEAGDRGLRVIMDLVPNHCSSDHAWFRDALAGAPHGRERSRFWFRDGRPHGDDPYGAPPNNWRAAFGGTAWTRAGDDDPQWYLGTFTPHQPDWNHTSPDVNALFDETLHFWFDRGVDGFRVDAITPVGKHPDLPDQPPVAGDLPDHLITWENPYLVFREEGHDVWRRFRATIDDYGQRSGRSLMMVAEAYLNEQPDLLAEFVHGDEFHQAFAFDVLLSPWTKPQLDRAIADSLKILDRGHAPAWALNNHDVQRIVTRLGRRTAVTDTPSTNNPLEVGSSTVDLDVGLRRARALITFVMALPGSLYVYNGEELGLPEVLDIPADRREDPVFIRTNGDQLGRDGCRVPLPWDADPATSFGFSAPEGSAGASEPWLPQPDWWGRLAVTEVEGDDTSTLELYRSVIAARAEHATPQGLTGEPIEFGPGLVAVERGELIAVMNVTSEPLAIDLGHPLLATSMPVFASEPREMHTPGVIPPDATIWFSR